MLNAESGWPADLASRRHAVSAEKPTALAAVVTGTPARS